MNGNWPEISCLSGEFTGGNPVFRAENSLLPRLEGSESTWDCEEWVQSRGKGEEPRTRVGFEAVADSLSREV